MKKKTRGNILEMVRVYFKALEVTYDAPNLAEDNPEKNKRAMVCLPWLL